MKKRFLAVLLLAVLLLPGCGKEKQTTFQVGDKVETYWFQFTVDQVKTTDRWMDYQPQEGSRLAVCYLTLESTFSEAVPMNWADLVLVWGGRGGRRLLPHRVSGPGAAARRVFPHQGGGAHRLPGV